jgi:cytosine/adenosine deaminase-related metal-dependent hydrolase
MILGYRSNYRRDDELELTLNMTTRGGADVMGAKGYGIGPGCRADLVIVRGETLAHAVVGRDARRLVIKNGCVVARDGVYLVNENL